MIRRLLNLLTSLSLLLCVAACVLWVRSYRDQQANAVVTERGARWFVSARGRLGLLMMDVPAGLTGWTVRRGTDHHDDMMPSLGRVLRRQPSRGFGGFEVASVRRRLVAFMHVRGVDFSAGEANDQGCPLDFCWIAAPHWAVVVAAAVAPAARAAGLLRRRRRPRPGLCPQCGYDLRATPHRCPECGR